MQTGTLALSGLKVFEPRTYTDERGFFQEIWRWSAYAAAGLPTFVQDNTAYSRRGVLRGLHFQNPDPQGKLITVLHGAIFDVAVDLRVDSPTFGRWAHCELSSSNHLQLYIPPGFAHGYQALSEPAVVMYKCTAYYNPATEMTLLFDDADVGVEWPLQKRIVSPRDRAGKRLADLPRDRLFHGH
jgi:dTDP-4-dehydrorhamnose 3,5-epimerase